MSVIRAVLACSIVFEASDEQLVSVTRQLLELTGPRGSAVFDNSDSFEARGKVQELCSESGIAYLGGRGNLGTGQALNELLVEAVASGRNQIFYMDQDSALAVNYRESLVTCLSESVSMLEVAAVGSRIHHRGDAVPGAQGGNRFVPARFLIASGTLYDVRAVLDIGGFDEGMFLDTVDHEFCFRARRAGMSLLQDTHRSVFHEIGTDSILISSRFNFRVTRHPTWRRELMWRNTVILLRRYGTAYPADCLRHALVRTVDTLLSAYLYRDKTFLSSAVRGVYSGLRCLSFDPSGTRTLTN